MSIYGRFTIIFSKKRFTRMSQICLLFMVWSYNLYYLYSTISVHVSVKIASRNKCLFNNVLHLLLTFTNGVQTLTHHNFSI